MNLRSLILSAPLLALAACGSTDETVFTLSTGTYDLSGATTTALRPVDQCGILAAYQDPAKVIGIAVAGSTVTFNLANDSGAPLVSLPTATLTGNTIAVPVEANYLAGPFGTDCLLRIHRRVQGELVGVDDARLELTFEVARESGTCNVADIPFSAVTCSSGYEFLATKLPPG
ncbi:MAG: hypothetical protein IPQ24_21310 [Anaeromyxobacter sp.]|nr:hypothetical protein [Anaeromyxobacter sp.]